MLRARTPPQLYGSLEPVILRLSSVFPPLSGAAAAVYRSLQVILIVGARCLDLLCSPPYGSPRISETQLDPLQCEAARLRDVPSGTSRFFPLDFLSPLRGGTPPGEQAAQARGQVRNPDHGIGDQLAEHQRALSTRQLFHLVGRQTPRISGFGGITEKRPVQIIMRPHEQLPSGVQG
jgi:hypothetical protein